jgi:hypothetical protein
VTNSTSVGSFSISGPVPAYSCRDLSVKDPFVMKDSLLLALASLLLSVAASPLTANVTTSNGPIYGNIRDASGIQGIPYAQPPVGTRIVAIDKIPGSPIFTCTAIVVQLFRPVTSVLL